MAGSRPQTALPVPPLPLDLILKNSSGTCQPQQLTAGSDRSCRTGTNSGRHLTDDLPTNTPPLHCLERLAADAFARAGPLYGSTPRHAQYSPAFEDSEPNTPHSIPDCSTPRSNHDLRLASLSLSSPKSNPYRTPVGTPRVSPHSPCSPSMLSPLRMVGMRSPCSVRLTGSARISGSTIIIHNTSNTPRSTSQHAKTAMDTNNTNTNSNTKNNALHVGSDDVGTVHVDALTYTAAGTPRTHAHTAANNDNDNNNNNNAEDTNNDANNNSGARLHDPSLPFSSSSSSPRGGTLRSRVSVQRALPFTSIQMKTTATTRSALKSSPRHIHHPPNNGASASPSPSASPLSPGAWHSNATATDTKKSGNDLDRFRSPTGNPLKMRCEPSFSDLLVGSSPAAVAHATALAVTLAATTTTTTITVAAPAKGQTVVCMDDDAKNAKEDDNNNNNTNNGRSSASNSHDDGCNSNDAFHKNTASITIADTEIADAMNNNNNGNAPAALMMKSAQMMPPSSSQLPSQLPFTSTMPRKRARKVLIPVRSSFGGGSSGFDGRSLTHRHTSSSPPGSSHGETGGCCDMDEDIAL